MLNEGISIRSADLPQIDELTVGFLAIFAQHECKLILERTKATLGQVKGWSTMPPAEIAQRLRRMGIPTTSGSGEWTYDKARAAIQLADAT